MSRYGAVDVVHFGEVTLPHPLSVRLGRRAEPASAAGQNDAFATSVQVSAATITAEVRLRGTAVAEALTLGQQDDLTFTMRPTSASQSARDVTVAGAVLVSIETVYEQASLASAVLRFVAEAADGLTDPVTAEDAA